MATPGKSSKWGSFLSQAVAGVESRLDNILTESEEGRSAAQSAVAASVNARTASPHRASPANSGPTISRPSSANRTNDRLQARLAKAMASKNAPQATGDTKLSGSPRSSTDNASRGSMERASIDTNKDQGYKSETPPFKQQPETIHPQKTTVEVPPTKLPAPSDSSDDPRPTKTEEQATTAVLSNEEKTEGIANEPAKGEQPETSEPTENGALAGDAAREMQEVKNRHQEEVQEYVERIDSLQSKLQYLSQSAADSAKTTAASAPSGSLERKLAERDERIALLMEEGQKLASSEQKYRSTIKKLRLQMSGQEKQLEELQKANKNALEDADAFRKRLNDSEEKERRHQETAKAITALQVEIDSLKKDRAKRDETIRKLELEVKSKVEQGEAAKANALSTALAAEREKHRELETTKAALVTEIQEVNEKNRLNTIDWTEKLARLAERNHSVEAELRAEIVAMEKKLEGMRAAAEEAASGSGGEAQVKLLRQIETLQTQYASARENWQGIETSLLAKATGLEKERDEAQRRESEMRKKARDAASRLRILEEELQDVQPALAASQQEVENCREQLAALRTSSKATESALERARADLEKEKRTAGRQWADEISGTASRNQSRPGSPFLPVSRTLSSDMVGLPIPNRTRRTPTPGSIPDSGAEGLGVHRRSPFQLSPRTRTMSTTGSNPPAPFSPFEPPSETSFIVAPSIAEQENGPRDTTPSSPRQLAQDMFSVSTVAAGPSVQLVERMSAAIRRLEAEKVGSKEEMARVCSQRDEARADIVGLMKDLEDAKAASLRVPQLEKEVADLDARYQTTLELLGEKSELVDELKADVEDVKAMYRELVERTVK